jgi:murein DD-endopeptidase MepM/ murein hydrolase activator NlpD
VSRPQPQRALARRAASLERRWPKAVRLPTGALNVGLATLAVTVLGLGVAASSLSTSSAQDTDVATAASAVVTTVAPGVKQPAAFQRDASTISRSNFREALSSDQTDELNAAALTEAADQAAQPAQLDQRAVRARAAALAKDSAAAAERDDALKEKLKAKKAKAKKKAEAARKALGTPTMPVKSYSIAARFGDVGAWARYHTGFDFSAPIGTPIYAPAAGVVTTAGSGSAGGWAGTYVVVEHADGTQSLYAHMSSVSVDVGERVKGGTLLGHVGQTGRSFGPHLHFEIYPAGAEPGDVYRAVDPQPWLTKLGLKP